MVRGKEIHESLGLGKIVQFNQFWQKTGQEKFERSLMLLVAVRENRFKFVEKNYCVRKHRQRVEDHSTPAFDRFSWIARQVERRKPH
jgi:hypothetical protein